MSAVKRHLTPLDCMVWLCCLFMLTAVLSFAAGDYHNADRASYAALALAVGFVLGCNHVKENRRGTRTQDL
jgi:hypothetical protein